MTHDNPEWRAAWQRIDEMIAAKDWRAVNSAIDSAVQDELIAPNTAKFVRLSAKYCMHRAVPFYYDMPAYWWRQGAKMEAAQ